MTILDRANAFIGHEQEVDEGYETTMRRNAFIAGFKEALGLVKKMREAQKAYPDCDFEDEKYEDESDRLWDEQCKLESEVDELIKEMEV